MLDRLFNRDAMKTYNDMVSRRKGQTTSKDLAAQNTGQSTTTPEALVAEPATINPETGTRYTPLSAVSPELVAEPVEQGLGSTPEAQTRRLATTPAATTAVTPAAAAAGTASASTPAIDAAIAQSAATRKRLADTLDESKETPLSRDQAQTRAEQENTDALKKAGVKSYKDRIDELKGQATQAREDRNTDRWLAVAQGFFAMGAGKSRYAMQNMAEGLGIGVSQLKDAEKEHRKAEQASKDRVALLEEGHRQETLGNVKAGRELFEKAQQREADRRKSDLATLGHLAGTDESGVTRLVTAHEAAETRKSISRDAALQRAATSADSMSLRKTISENAQTEAKRQHDLQDAATRRTLYARAVEKHPGYKTLQELSQSIADMQSRPDLTIEQQKNLQAKITQHNALQAAIHTAADAAAQREFGAGGGGFSNFRQGQ
jgi:hypothetical protein